jgi:hypothetical protein
MTTAGLQIFFFAFATLGPYGVRRPALMCPARTLIGRARHAVLWGGIVRRVWLHRRIEKAAPAFDGHTHVDLTTDGSRT